MANQVVTSPQLSLGTCQRGRIAYQRLAGDVLAQDFLGVLFGDCTGNWMPTAGGGAAATDGDLTRVQVRLGRWRGDRTGTVSLPIAVDADQPFTALDLELRYDSRHLRAVGVRRARSARQALLSFNPQVPGVLKVALASAEPIETTDAPLLIVHFERFGGHLGRDAVQVGELAVDDRVGAPAW